MKKSKILILLSIVLSIVSACMATDLYNILIRLSLIPVVLIPHILRKLNFDISDNSEFIFIIFVFLAHFLGSIMGLYNKIYWFDTFCHSLFGFMFSFFVLEYIFKKKYKTSKTFECLFIVSSIALFAVLWEIFEFTGDNIFGKDAQKVLETGVNDTMKDLIVALLGSILFCTCYLYEYLNKKKLIIMHFLDGLK